MSIPAQDPRLRPPRVLVLAALRAMGRPGSADAICERLLLDHGKHPDSIHWRPADVSHVLRAAVAAGEVDRVGMTREGFAARIAGRMVPVYALSPDDRDWQDRTLLQAAARCGGQLGADLLRIRTVLKARGVIP
jgi:hypothetical protein